VTRPQVRGLAPFKLAVRRQLDVHAPVAQFVAGGRARHWPRRRLPSFSARGAPCPTTPPCAYRRCVPQELVGPPRQRRPVRHGASKDDRLRPQHVVPHEGVRIDRAFDLEALGDILRRGRQRHVVQTGVDLLQALALRHSPQRHEVDPRRLASTVTRGSSPSRKTTAYERREGPAGTAVPPSVLVDQGDGGVQRVVVDGDGHIDGPRQARRRRQQARAVRPLARVEPQGGHRGRGGRRDDGVSGHCLVVAICVDGRADGGAQHG